jgi:hypothetical protein
MGTRGSSQLNGREADVSTILGRTFGCGKKSLVVVLLGARAPPLSSLSGRVRDRTSEGGEINSSRSACDVYISALHAFLHFCFPLLFILLRSVTSSGRLVLSRAKKHRH